MARNLTTRKNGTSHTEPATFTGNGLRRYLIIFDPHTLVLDRQPCTCQGTPSLQFVMPGSKNFTSSLTVHRAQSTLIISDQWCSADSSLPNPSGDLRVNDETVSTPHYPTTVEEWQNNQNAGRSLLILCFVIQPSKSAAMDALFCSQ
eukprot:TRINITY_DN10619_c7_g1_i7.p1 TRINITY_DN10619_c7_g1~~TRINITY_DN10619_c7_g1_i7.p1  ORF type:complete len:147 (+),score=0.34 TRINITY_DN10619_c7_g1_i7:89-529(+)